MSSHKKKKSPEVRNGKRKAVNMSRRTVFRVKGLIKRENFHEVMIVLADDCRFPYRSRLGVVQLKQKREEMPIRCEIMTAYIEFRVPEEPDREKRNALRYEVFRQAKKAHEALEPYFVSDSSDIF